MAKKTGGWHKPENQLQLQPKKTDAAIVESERIQMCVAKKLKRMKK